MEAIQPREPEYAYYTLRDEGLTTVRVPLDGIIEIADPNLRRYLNEQVADIRQAQPSLHIAIAFPTEPDHTFSHAWTVPRRPLFE